MRTTWAMAAVVCCAGCNNAVTNPDAFHAARAGALACVIPDRVQKRCNTLNRYTFAEDGSVQADMDITMGGPPHIVMSTSASFALKGNELCGSTSLADIQKATFRIDGRPASAKEAASFRETLVSNLTSRGAQAYCVSFHPAGDAYELRASYDGVARPEFTETVIWVRPEDGYRVGP